MYTRIRIMLIRSTNNPRRLISSEEYDREKYLEMLLDSAEAVLSVFGFNRSQFGFERKKTYHWWNEIINNARKTSDLQNQNYEN